MATRANQERPKPKTSNPVAHVSYERRDLVGVDPPTGGGGKELVPVTPALRRDLANSLANAAAVIGSEANSFPSIPGVMVVRLRDTAVAKSHRPITLIAEAAVAQAGHGEINEMLLAVYPSSIGALERVIRERDTKQIRANLSTIERFLPWDASKRLPKRFRDKSLQETLTAFRRYKRRLMVRLFSHDSSQTTDAIIARFGQLLHAHRLSAVRLEQHAGPPVFFVEMGQALSIQAFTALVQFQGVRRIAPEPLILPTATASATTGGPVFTTTPPEPNLPVVAVFDTGVDPSCTALLPWVKSRDVYVLPPDTDYFHGTAVSSLVVDSHGLNGGHLHFPKTSGCLIHDVCGLESSINGSPISDLVIRLREAIQKRPDIKVWNLSLGGPEIGDAEFSWFGRELDALSDKFGVLFVVAAGNYQGKPRRGWPTTGTALADRLSSPGDSIRALTVGAVTHLESPASLVRIGEPAPYSRRGPGPVFTPKPDIVHIGGNADANLSSAGIGVNVLSAAGTTTGCGTSYAAPIASGLAAKTWHALAAPGRSNPLTVSPAMVKALLIHNAQLNSPERDVAERRYYGAGMPGDPVAVLYDSDSSFTMLFELDIVDSMKWRKAPFPIPPSLLADGKLKAEVIVTVAYAPPVDDSKGAEYVRFNVDVGFGRLSPNAKGKLAFHGCVPAEGEEGTNGFEQAQVEHGGKWSPVKVYRRVFKNGVAGNIWALQATLLRRAFEPPLTKPLRVVIAVTLRALDNNPNVYGEGRRVLAQSNWISQDIASRIDLPVRT